MRSALARIPALDGVRGIAVAGVLVGHYSSFGSPAGFGVALFFALSGFLITRLLLEEHASSGTIRLRSFYWRRACRIIPAYLVWVMASWLLVGDAGSAADRVELFSLLTYTKNYLGTGTQGLGAMVNHAWSLAMEEQFYLLWPIALLIVAPRRAPLLLVVSWLFTLTWRAVAYAALDAHPSYLAWSFESNIGYIAVGCLLALIATESRLEPLRRVGRPALANLAVLIAGAVLLFTLDDDFAASAVWAPALASLVLVLLLALVIALEPAVLTHRALVWLGAISYPLYLWHVWGWELASIASTNDVARALIAIVLSLLLASASFYLLERPVLRWRDRATSSEKADSWPCRVTEPR